MKVVLVSEGPRALVTAGLRLGLPFRGDEAGDGDGERDGGDEMRCSFVMKSERPKSQRRRFPPVVFASGADMSRRQFSSLMSRCTMCRSSCRYRNAEASCVVYRFARWIGTPAGPDSELDLLLREDLIRSNSVPPVLSCMMQNVAKGESKTAMRGKICRCWRKRHM